MIIKSYVADTAAEALKHIRSELGGDAVVLKTREVASVGRNRRIEVTACIDRAKAPVHPTAPVDAAAGTSTAAVMESATAVNEVNIERMAEIERKLDRILQMNAPPTTEGSEETTAFAQRLQAHDFPREFIEWCIGDATAGSADDDNAETGLKAALERSVAGMMADEIVPATGERVVVFGLPGAGKTSVLGKLTARLVGQEDTKVRLMTLDNVKVGALDEIGSYSDLLGADLRLSGVTEKSSPQGEHDDVVLLIDTAGFSAAPERTAAMEAQIEALDPQYRILVFSALSRTADLEQLSGSLARLRPTHLVMTMTDLTERRGALAAIAQGTGAPLVFVTDAPAGLGSLTTPDAAVMAEQILASEESHE